MLNDGIHEAIVSEELWNQVHKKRQETGVANIKTHSLDHEHILSGIIKCPICGSGMYGNVNNPKFNTEIQKHIGQALRQEV